MTTDERHDAIARIATLLREALFATLELHEDANNPNADASKTLMQRIADAEHALKDYDAATA